MIRFDNTYIGKQVVFLNKYEDHNNIIVADTTGVIIEVISSYKALIIVKGIKIPIVLYNHWVDGINVIIKG